MNLVFDGPAYPLGLVLHSAFALVPLGFWAYRRFVSKRGNSVPLLAVAAGIFLVTNGIVLWDQLRIRKLVEEGSALHVTRGVVTQSWHIVSRERDWTRSTLSYKTTVSEGFDVAGVRFRWNVADSYSPATFSNAREPKLSFPEGSRVEVTWFVDAATQDERRIIRLRMQTPGGGPGPADPAFAQVMTRFADALASSDHGTLLALTRFPLSFGGHAVAREQADTLWMALSMPAIQTCLRTFIPETLPDGGRRLACHDISLVFGRTDAGAWQLHEVRQGT